MHSKNFLAQLIAALARDTPAYEGSTSLFRFTNRPSDVVAEDQGIPPNRFERTESIEHFDHGTRDIPDEGQKPASEMLLTITEVAATMRVSKMTVYRLMHSGELPAIRFGRSFRIPGRAVAQYVRERQALYMDVHQRA